MSRVPAKLFVFASISLFLFVAPVVANATTPTTVSTISDPTAPTSAKLVVPILNVPIPGLVFDKTAYAEKGVIYIPLLGQYISVMFNYIVGLSLVAAAIMFIYGAFLYLFGATGLKVADAKTKMMDALIGLLIILGAYAIVTNINPNLTIFGAIKVPKTTLEVWRAKQIENVATDMVGKKSDAKCDLTGKVRNFKQYEPPWGGLPFGGKPLCTADQLPTYKDSSGAPCCTTYGSSACGITSLADVLASYGEDVDPQKVGDPYIKAGHRDCNFGGSSPQLGLDDWQKANSLDKYAVDKSFKADQLEDTLQHGYPVMILSNGCKACAGEGNCKTWNSHWFVLSGIKDADNYTISDPGGPYTYMAKSQVSTCANSLILVRPKDGSPTKGC